MIHNTKRVHARDADGSSPAHDTKHSITISQSVASELEIVEGQQVVFSNLNASAQRVGTGRHIAAYRVVDITNSDDSSVELGTVSGATGTDKVDARFDSGAKRTVIARPLAEAIGIPQPINEIQFRSSTDDGDTREIVHITVIVKGQKHEIKTSVTDRSNGSTDLRLRLGRDVLQDYLVDVEQ